MDVSLMKLRLGEIIVRRCTIIKNKSRAKKKNRGKQLVDNKNLDKQKIFLEDSKDNEKDLESFETDANKKKIITPDFIRWIITAFISVVSLGFSIFTGLNTYNLSKNNSVLIYDYASINLINPIEKNGLPFEIVDTGKDVKNSTIDIEIELNIERGQIKSVYIITPQINNNDGDKTDTKFDFELLNGDTLLQNNFGRNRYCYSTQLENNTYRKANGLTETKLYFLIVDVKGEIYIDYLQLISEINKVIETKSNDIKIIANVYMNHRLVKNNKFISKKEIDEINKTWENENIDELKNFDINQDEIVEDMKNIRNQYSKFY